MRQITDDYKTEHKLIWAPLITAMHQRDQPREDVEKLINNLIESNRQKKLIIEWEELQELYPESFSREFLYNALVELGVDFPEELQKAAFLDRLNGNGYDSSPMRDAYNEAIAQEWS